VGHNTATKISFSGFSMLRSARYKQTGVKGEILQTHTYSRPLHNLCTAYDSCVVEVHRRFKGAYCLHHRHPRWRQYAHLKRRSATRLHSARSQKLSASYSPPWDPEISSDTFTVKWRTCCLLWRHITWCLCFRLLDLVPKHLDFIALSFAIRIVEALGASAATTAAFAITAAVFPDSVATTFVSISICPPGHMYQLQLIPLPYMMTLYTKVPQESPQWCSG
jgi:hypothetical protein